MRINRIELYNIGPYEGSNIFDIAGQRQSGHVIVIGGKNGAGKTTLFSGIKLCLYGYKESGYEAICPAYKKNITKLINDKAKAENNPNAKVMMDISVFNGQEWDNFVLSRAWDLNSDLFEEYRVVKNGKELSADEIIDFDSFLLDLIPPELFELYFFDGEQIADYFLEDKNNERIKTALLTICGYDTFDILLKNFRRVGKGSSTKDDVLNLYLEAEEALSEAEKNVHKLEALMDDIQDNLETEDAALKKLEDEYKASGGVTSEQWNEKFASLKSEERLREEKNAALKNAANDVIPYIIVHDNLVNLLEQIENEREAERINILRDSVSTIIPNVLLKIGNEHPEFSTILQELVRDEIVSEIEKTGNTNEVFLGLSNEEYRQLTSLLGKLISIDKNQIISIRNEIKESIDRSQAIREEIESSHVDGVQDYLNEKDKIIARKAELLRFQQDAIEKKKSCAEALAVAQAEYAKRDKELEKQLKNESISNLTTRSIVFLETLQKRLLKSEILRVEDLFMQKMSQLMRKERFIDAIHIDNAFVIHVYKTISIECKGVCEKIRSMTPEKYEIETGKLHVDDILRASQCITLQKFVDKFADSEESIDVLMEFDKATMSKGERQVFIMALYWAMMQLSNKEVPFVIDTPFARIDTIHRENITKFFFKQLRGQVFIFSTDEEITQNHLELLGDDLTAKYLIENIDNTKTTIKSNTYFE